MKSTMNIIEIIKSLFGRKAENDESRHDESLTEQRDSAVLLKTINEGEKFDLNFGPENIINAVTVADCHGSLTQRELKEKISEAPDIVFLLGDNSEDDIEAVLEFFNSAYPNKEISYIGITGNHDGKSLLHDSFSYRVTDLHRNLMMYNDVRIAGFGGSIRYKPDDYYTMFSNEESEQMMSALPCCDLLITHDKPCFEKPETVTSHSGLTGIGTYIREHSPKIVLHGHLHDRYAERYKSTLIRCCYRVEEFTIRL